MKQYLSVVSCAVVAGVVGSTWLVAVGAPWCTSDVSAPTLSVTYDHAPEFLVVDSIGRQRDSFQFFFPSVPEVYNTNGYVVRGSESACRGELVAVVREGWTEDPDDPCSGGWGQIVEVVPLEIEGPVVSFTLLGGLPPGTGVLELYHFGAWDTGSCDSLTWADCTTGPLGYAPPDCWDLDLDGGFTVDLKDFALAQGQVEWPL